MTLSDLSVRRPVFAAVAAIILCVIGVAAYFVLPVRELPNVDAPVISISTSYRGASAEVVEERITQIIERQVAGIQGIDRVKSNSRDGVSRIQITFLLSRNLDAAANDVRDAVARVTAQLPDQADPPQISKAQSEGTPLIFLNLISDKGDRLALADYANRYLVERLSTIPGVGSVGLSGAQIYSMRIWLDADALAARSLTVDDVENALLAQNVELPAGSLESKSKDFTIRVKRGYSTPQEFAQLPIVPAGLRNAVAQVNGVTNASGISAPLITRLGDVARVEEGADDRRRLFKSNGQSQVGMFINRQSQSNDLEISAAVAKELEDIRATLPAGMKITVSIDSSIFTREAIKEVWGTMAISLALVAAVNFLFLGTWRAALIPSVVAPICILSTFIILAPLGFSINLLTLLALVLAIGLVVDDAIVVVENIQRRIDEGEPPLLAAERGAKQVFFAVIATTVVLLSVFAPLMVLPGYIGRLFVELAVAIAAAVAFSALLALSLSPMLASKLLRPSSHGKGEGRGLSGGVDRVMEQLRTSYRASLEMLTARRRSAAGVLGLVVLLGALAGLLFVVLPKELVPSEDRGRVDISVTAPEGAGYDYTVAAMLKAERYFKSLYDKGDLVRYNVGVPRFGQSQYSTGSGVLVLKDWSHRKITADQIAADANKALSGLTSARVVASVRGPFQRGGGGGSGSNVDFIASGNSYEELAVWIDPIFKAAQDNPGLARPRLNYEPTSPRVQVELDRDKAAALGVSAQAVGRALETMFGSRKTTTYVRAGQEYDVILQTDLEKRRSEQDLNSLYVRSGSGELVPLSAVVKTTVRGDTPDRERIDRQRSITLTAELNPGYTVEEAVTFYRAEAAKQAGKGVTLLWGGQAKDYLEASGGVTFAFAMALLLVFLVLAAQFESWIHPAVIMLTVPLAALGGLFGLLMAGSSINTYSQIGLIILVGVAAKNGILIVEFANQLRDDGLKVREAVIEASVLRLRPIIMTSISAACGSLPLMLASGPGAGSRRTIGVVIFSGAIFATLLTLFVVPVIYNLLARYTKSPDWTARQIETFEKEQA
jgi:multidrug efflux pump